MEASETPAAAFRRLLYVLAWLAIGCVGLFSLLLVLSWPIVLYTVHAEGFLRPQPIPLSAVGATIIWLVFLLFCMNKVFTYETV